MIRKDIIYNYIKEISQKINLNEVEGFDTVTISDNLGIDRANVSRELNTLVREGKVLKISGRPVLYIDKEVANKLNKRKELKNKKRTVDNKKDSFCSMVGWKGSLSKIVQLAKAAVMYPPNGLHVLLTGPTGSGKTMFAEMMYRYALDNKVIDEHGDFIIFNCAEYANNPQLLLSQLFGHVKGAFTGATTDKIGIVEKAQGGILLLDEIHRLPPEGQEMLFSLIDKRKYRRLGEVENIQSKILIIGATTEDIDSCIIKSFLRRITMVINMPSLIERLLKKDIT